MKKYILAFLFLIALVSCSKSKPESNKQEKLSLRNGAGKLEQVFADSTYQLTGVAISPDRRLFVNYPYWMDKHSYSVVEVGKDGKAKPYPDAAWNSFKKGEDGQNKFVCVQAVFADEKGYLWVVDAAGIGLSEVYRKSNKLIQIDLKSNKIKRIYRFPENVAGRDSYINDIRVDNKNGFAYMTSSANGGIVILNINTGESRLVLHNHYSTLSDPDYHFKMNNKEMKNDKGEVKINSDGIALTPDKVWLYYKSLTDNNLYRINTSLLRNFKISEKTIEDKVEDLGKFVATDGMEFDKDGNLYMGDLEHSSIIKIRPDNKMTTLVQDTDKLSWPDSYSISEDGYLYISCSQIHQMPFFNNGQNLTKLPYKVFRLKIK
ncbi:L-dopachrome tautomerase-related protein [Chryseobacterium polytrichastri]|uniref:Major royal jelly protein n=1 Tax=Chryseobacterium polytrichastri TaxID=1302687 RepID=A0A1M7GEP7_9FLAO|nr:L-dopachrome tautomerase-related protein [Chryseobacterium polytrichastri]SHM14588.1 Major royal jelly protein [Chryseobacterium polytrichastri]